MPVPVFTIKVKAGEPLMRRIREVCEYLEVSSAQFIEYAIDNELGTQEGHRINEDIALEEIRNSILASGQSMEIYAGEEEPEAACELCLAPIHKPKKVDGPLLCEDCLTLAKGTPRPATGSAG